MDPTDTSLRGLRVVLAVLPAIALVSACDFERSAPDALPDDVADRVRALYERAREAGDDVPGDAYQWAREDVERIGDWEYRVLRLSDDADESIEEELDRLGEERWEVFWLERREEGYRAFLKRRSRSFLRMVPLGELGRLAPDGNP